MAGRSEPGAHDEPLRLLVVDDEAPARLRLRALLDALPEAGAVIVGEAGDADGGARAAAGPSRPTPCCWTSACRAATACGWRPRCRPCRGRRRWSSSPPMPGTRCGPSSWRPSTTSPSRCAASGCWPRLQRVRQRLRPSAAPPEGPALVVHDRGRVLRLPHAEVLVLKAEQKYVTLRTAEHAYVLDESLTDLEQRLGAAFVRIHRNALVARRAIRELQLRGSGADGWAVRVAPLDEWLAVSRRQLATVRAALAGGDGAP